MMTINDEIEIANLVHGNRRQSATGSIRANSLPATAKMIEKRIELVGEIRVTPYTATDFTKPDLLQAAIYPLPQGKLIADMVKREQVGGTMLQITQQSLITRFAA